MGRSDFRGESPESFKKSPTKILINKIKIYSFTNNNLYGEGIEPRG